MLGAGTHVVLAGEAAVHQCLNEITTGTLLGLVDAALPQHLRTDDRGGLLGEHRVPGQVMAARMRIGHQDHHPAFERLAQPDCAGDTRPDALVWTDDGFDAGVVSIGSARGSRHVGLEHPAYRLGQRGQCVRGQSVVRHHMSAGVEGDGRIACQVGYLSDERLKPRAPVKQARQRRMHMRRVAHHMHFLAERSLSEQAIECRKPHGQSHFDDDHARR